MWRLPATTRFDNGHLRIRCTKKGTKLTKDGGAVWADGNGMPTIGYFGHRTPHTKSLRFSGCTGLAGPPRS